MDLLSRALPGVELHALVAARDQILAQCLVGEHAADSAGDVENIFRIYQQRRRTKHFGQRGDIGSDHGRPVGHGFERRQPEAFVERWKEKGAGVGVKDAQHVMRNESQKAHLLPHARAHDFAPQSGVFGQLVPNHNELQITEGGMAGQLGFHHGEGLDQPREILLRADVPGVQQEGIVHGVAFQNAFGVGGQRLAKKALVERVVDHLDFFFRDAEDTGELALRGVRNGEDSRGAVERAPGKLAAQRSRRPYSLRQRAGVGIDKIEQVMHGDHHRAGRHQRRVEPRFMQHVHLAIAEKQRQAPLVAKRFGQRDMLHPFEMRRQSFKLVAVAHATEEQVAGGIIRAPKVVDDVANVGSQAVAARAPDVDGDFHGWRYPDGCIATSMWQQSLSK